MQWTYNNFVYFIKPLTVTNFSLNIEKTNTIKAKKYFKICCISLLLALWWPNLFNMVTFVTRIEKCMNFKKKMRIDEVNNNEHIWFSYKGGWASTATGRCRGWEENLESGPSPNFQCQIQRIRIGWQSTLKPSFIGCLFPAAPNGDCCYFYHDILPKTKLIMIYFQKLNWSWYIAKN